MARMSPNIPAHQALRLQVDTSLGRRPDRDWVRSSSRPRNRWIDQLRQDHQRHLLTYSEQLSSVVTLERRYGPRRLRDDDDDDDTPFATVSFRMILSDLTIRYCVFNVQYRIVRSLKIIRNDTVAKDLE